MRIRLIAAVWHLLFGIAVVLGAQQQVPRPLAKTADQATAQEKASEKATIPFQIQLLETHIRFESTGDSRKEVHTIVKLSNAAGAQQFARLAFDYNRAYQQVEIPMVRVTHANGGTSEVMPSAVTDAPNPAVEKFPAYQDVRVKSVRILGLQEGDQIEYRVITTTRHPPLSPHFWLEHSFDHSGEVLEEEYQLEVPGSGNLKVWTSTAAADFQKKASSEGSEPRRIYLWRHSSDTHPTEEAHAGENATKASAEVPQVLKDSDVAITTFESGATLKGALQKSLRTGAAPKPEIKTKAQSLTASATSSREKLTLLYYFVAQNITPVDLPLSATRFVARPPEEILSSGYASPEDKAVLLSALAEAIGLPSKLALTGANVRFLNGPLLPSQFTNVLIVTPIEHKNIWMDPSEAVTPFGMIPANLRGKPAIFPCSQNDTQILERVTRELPFAAFQKVTVNATLSDDGKLTAKVKYTLRGDNELLLRVAFHQTAKQKWKDVAGLLALSDGFRGVITAVDAADPMATKGPFTVEYELTQPKFVDWSKKPVRIPALLPQIGLPDTSGRSSAGNIDLGTPLDVATQVTLHLPAGSTVQAPAGTAVERDYATYTSKYAVTPDRLTALRHIHFLRREIAADRSMDYNAFVQAVQNDQSQFFVLNRGVGVKSAALQ